LPANPPLFFPPNGASGAAGTRHAQVMLAHGMCHLMGYTHEDADARAAMQDRELRALSAFQAPGVSTSALLAASYLPPPWGLPAPGP
jgi:hypothetical protein